MVISGIFIVDSLKDKDSEGFERIAVVHNQMDEGISFECFLPPYVRPSQCKIKSGSKVWGIADTTTGMGVALYGFGDADVDFINRNNYHFTETVEIDKSVTAHDTVEIDKSVTTHDTLTVQSNITSQTGNIVATAGDVKATAVSLLTHVHAVPTIPIPTAMPNNPAIPAVFPGATTTTPT